MQFLLECFALNVLDVNLNDIAKFAVKITLYLDLNVLDITINDIAKS